MKRCTKCGQRKPARAFPLFGMTRPGVRHRQCTSCQVAAHRKRADASRQWIREYAAGWHRTNQHLIESANAFLSRNGRRGVRLAHYYRLRHEAILAYGGYRCACCGADEALFLTIDHVNEGGNRHRREVGTLGQFLRWLANNGYPSGFQVLCSNCNQGRYRNGGVCPHKDPIAKPRCRPGRLTRR
ncbi:MAG: hypothetical protein JO128_12530 [Alphaproteobacteria bacterium]|nr:hypothetical protein [Alphaproteobacteria bacterium]